MLFISPRIRKNQFGPDNLLLFGKKIENMTSSKCFLLNRDKSFKFIFSGGGRGLKNLDLEEVHIQSCIGLSMQTKN